MQKRGQFYLIAALVIVGVAAALATIYATADFKKENTRVYDLTSEIDYESSLLFDRTSLTQASLASLEGNLTEIADFYTLSNSNVDLLLLFGNESRLVVIVYNNTGLGSSCISFGGSQACAPSTTGSYTRTEIDRTAIPRDVPLTIQIDSETYHINLVPGKPFLAVLKKEEGEERFVAISEDELRHTQERRREDDD